MKNDYIVKKSNYFIMNCKYDLSIQEQRIILTLASMIKSTDEEFKEYKFSTKEFKELLNLKGQSVYSEIPKITKKLLGKTLEIENEHETIQCGWIATARHLKKEGFIILRISPDLKPYMLQLNTLYTSYRLKNVLSMKSKYSIRIYEILKCHEFKQQSFIDISIDELRKLLKAENIYPKYANFKQKILEVVKNELEEQTDISFNYEEFKTGRTITDLRIFIHKKNSLINTHSSKNEFIKKQTKSNKKISEMPRQKTKFHNFNETFTKYTTDELDDIISKSQKEKFK
ncbi:TPA: replication initiation protein [Clostridioides difficile]|nr:replication initiation protein [Clostridioides difficile]